MFVHLNIVITVINNINDNVIIVDDDDDDNKVNIYKFIHLSLNINYTCIT